MPVERQPLRVIVDSRLETPLTARILQGGNVLMFCAVDNAAARAALEGRGAEVVNIANANGKVELPAMLAELGRRGINELHVEAGVKLNGSLVREGCVDELLVYLAPLPLFLVGLSSGVAATAVAGVSGVAVAGLMGGAAAAGIYGVVHGLPAWLVTRHALAKAPAPAGGAVAWAPPGEALAALGLLAAGALVLAAVGVWGADASLREGIETYLNATFAELAPDISAADRTRAAARIAPWLPGAIGGSWILMVTANAALAQWLLTRSGRALRPTPAYATLALPDRLSFAIVGAAAAALLLPGDLRYTGRNLVLILAVPFFLLGLTVVHTAIRRLPMGRPLLVAAYFTMALSSLAMGAVAILGLGEQWIGLRSRLAVRASPPKE